MPAMKSALVIALLAAAAALPAAAQTAAPPPAPASAPEAGLRSEPRVQRTVVEDDGVRIEELKVRGRTQSIVVRSKQGPGGRYEVLSEAGREGAGKEGAGRRVWNVLDF
jgi:hypothetical protein